MHNPQTYSLVVCPRSPSPGMFTAHASCTHPSLRAFSPLLPCFATPQVSLLTQSSHISHTPRVLEIHTHRPVLIQPTLHTLNPFHTSLSVLSHSPSTLITFCSSVHSTLTSPHPSYELHAPTLMCHREPSPAQPTLPRYINVPITGLLECVYICLPSTSPAWVPRS